MAKHPPEGTGEVDLDEVNARVSAESKRFRKRLPELLPGLSGKWVVFKDGEVASVHETGEAAYVAGLDQFGPYGGQVIAEVREPEVVVIGGLVAVRT